MRGCGALSARHSLRPFQFEGETFDVRTRAPAARSRRCVSDPEVVNLIVIASGAKQSIFDLAMPSHGLLRSARKDGRRSEAIRCVGWVSVRRAHPHIAPTPASASLWPTLPTKG